MGRWRADLLLGGVALEEVEGVVEVEDELRALALDRGVVAREAALGVVGREDLAVRLEHADDHEDLELAVEGDGVPLLRGREAGLVAAEREDLVRARDELRRAREVAEEGGHGDAAVLDLGVAEVADGALVAEAPEVGVEGAERVPAMRRAVGRRSRAARRGGGTGTDRARPRAGRGGRGGDTHQKPMAWPRKSGLASARATTSSLVAASAVPADTVDGAT